MQHRAEEITRDVFSGAIVEARRERRAETRTPREVRGVPGHASARAAFFLARGFFAAGAFFAPAFFAADFAAG